MSTKSGGPFQKLRAILAELRPAGVVAAYLFGSHAEGRAHRDSDIDVGLLFDFHALPSRKDRFERAVSLSSDFAAALHTDRMDVVVLNDAPPGLAARIVTRGERLYLSNAEDDHAFRRDSQLRAADLIPFLTRAAKLKLESLAK